MYLRARLLRYAGFGFLLGMVMGNLIAFLTRTPDGGMVSRVLAERTGSQAGTIAVQTLLSGLYGAAAVSGMLLYEIDDWSLAKATVIHCLIVAGLYILLSLILGWAEPWTDLLIVEGFQLIAFILIWLIMNLRYRKKVSQLNMLLHQHKEEQTE